MTFDIHAFTQTAHAEVPQDKFIGIPPNEYLGQIGNDDKALSMKTGIIANGDNAGKPWASLSVRINVADPAGALKATHGDKPGINYNIFLDLAPGSTAEAPIVDWGTNKNIRVGKLLEVTGCRKPGWKWTDLLGKSLKIKVEEVADKKTGDPRNEVVFVAPAQ